MIIKSEWIALFSFHSPFTMGMRFRDDALQNSKFSIPFFLGATRRHFLSQNLSSNMFSPHPQPYYLILYISH
jgi:hypothetical protein